MRVTRDRCRRDRRLACRRTLANGGAEVALVARGATLAASARDGLTAAARATGATPIAWRPAIARRTCPSPMPWCWPSRPTRFADAVAHAPPCPPPWPAGRHGHERPAVVVPRRPRRAAEQPAPGERRSRRQGRRACWAACGPSAPWCMRPPAPRRRASSASPPSTASSWASPAANVSRETIELAVIR